MEDQEKKNETKLPREIWELIFVQLSPKELFTTASLVCSTWRQVINASEALWAVKLTEDQEVSSWQPDVAKGETSLGVFKALKWWKQYIIPFDALYNMVEHLPKEKMSAAYKGEKVFMTFNATRRNSDITACHQAIPLLCYVTNRVGSDNVLRMLGMVCKDGRVGLVSEMMDGSLEALIKGPTLNLHTKIDILLQAAKGLEYLHTLPTPFTVRDIRPTKILYRVEHGRCQVKVALHNHLAFQPGTAPLYTPPENLRSFGGKKNSTPASDVYGFAMVMWEFYTGQTPFGEYDSLEPFTEAVCKRKERPSIPGDCPEDLALLMQDCWAHEPSARPTATEIVQRLEAIQQSLL